MRKLLMIAIALSVASLPGCDKANNGKPKPEPSIIGSWKVQKEQYISEQDGKVLYERVVTDKCDKEKSSYEFFVNGKAKYENYGTIEGNCQLLYGGEPTYKYDPATKKITIDDFAGDVLELTDHSLIMSIKSDRLRKFYLTR